MDEKQELLRKDGSMTSMISDVFGYPNHEKQERDHKSLDIWQQMSYVPPHGPCGFKASLISPACPCLRFMIHPMKAATSFECDGCSHHASFHKMRSKSEETSASRWTRADGSFDREAYELDEEVQEARAKRIRLGHPGDISSNRDITMPSKAKQTLMDSGKKRTRSGAAQGY